jgi:hypothetical protein
VQHADRLSLEDSLELLLQNLPPRVERPDQDPDDVRRMNALLEVVMSPEARTRPGIEELDNQLATLLGGRDPVIARRAPQPVEPPLPGEEVHSPVVATQTSRYESDDEVRKLKLPRPAPPRPQPQPGVVTGPTEEASLTLDPQRTRTLEHEPRPSFLRRIASVLAVAFTVVAIAGVAFLLGIGVMYLAGGPEDERVDTTPVDPQVVAPVEETPPVETPVADPFTDATRIDVTDITDTPAILLRKSLRSQITARWPGVAQACGVPAGDHLLKLAVGDGGVIEGGTLHGVTAQQEGCVTKALASAPLAMAKGSPPKLAIRMLLTAP